MVVNLIFLLLTGTLAGFSAGLLGIGGGIILAPFFFFYFEKLNVSPAIISQMVFGTNLFIIIFTSLSSSLGHHLNKNVLWKAVFPIAFGSIAGALTGAKVASIVPSFVLEKAFALLLFYSSFQVFCNIKKEKDGEPIFNHFYFAAVGILAGFVGALLGVGGGIIMVPVMILLFRFPVKKVAGTSSSIIVITSLTATISYVIFGYHNPHLPANTLGFVHYKAALPVMIGTVLSAHLGVYVNKRINTQNLKRVFALFLFIIAVRIMFF